MKKLITILFLFSFWANAQIESSENWKFKPDKRLHFGAGIVLSVISYPLMYDYTGGDIELSRNAAWLIPTFAALGKEFLDLGKLLLINKGAGFSFADFSYTLVGALIATLIINWIIKKNNKLINFGI